MGQICIHMACTIWKRPSSRVLSWTKILSPKQISRAFCMRSTYHILLIYFLRGTAKLYLKCRSWEMQQHWVNTAQRMVSPGSAWHERHATGHWARVGGPSRASASVAQCLSTLGDLWRVLTLFLFQPGAEQLPSQELTHLLLQEVRYE